MADLLDLMGDARAAAEKGMAAAVDHADRASPQWAHKANAFLRAYARQNDCFMAEDVRLWASRNGLPDPPDSRAWGAVINRAAKAGMMRSAGLAASRQRSGHGHPATVWRSNISRGEAQL